MNTPLISVVIPAYNAGAFIEDAIQSALCQTGVTQEIIVVNDGSTDDTAQKLAQYGDRIRVIHQPNRGLSASRNVGIATAQGDYITFLDADDCFNQPERQAQFMADFQKKPTFSIVAGQFQCFKFYDKTQLTAPRIGALMSTCIIKKTAFDTVGGFDTQYAVGESIDWLLRAEHAGLTIKKVDRVVLLRREHANNMTKTIPLSGYMDVIKTHIRRRKAIV